MSCNCAGCKKVRADNEAREREAKRIAPSPPAGTEWVIRYRVKGSSAVWPDLFTVCEIVGGPQDGEIRLIENKDFERKLEKKRRVKA